MTADFPEALTGAVATGCIISAFYNDKNKSCWFSLLKGLLYVLCMLVFLVEPLSLPIGLFIAEGINFLMERVTIQRKRAQAQQAPQCKGK